MYFYYEIFHNRNNNNDNNNFAHSIHLNNAFKLIMMNNDDKLLHYLSPPLLHLPSPSPPPRNIYGMCSLDF